MAQLWCQNSQITETEIICWLRVVSVSGHNIAAHSNTFRVAAYSLHHTPPPSDTEQTQLLNMLISPQILSQCVIGNFAQRQRLPTVASLSVFVLRERVGPSVAGNYP